MKKILSIFTVLFTILTFGQNIDPYLQPNSSPTSGQWNKGTLQVDGDFVLPTTLNSFTNPSLRDYGKLRYDTNDSIPKFFNGNEWISLIQDLQSVTEKGNITTNPIGVATDSIHQSVMLMQIGDDSPKDDKNLVAIAYTYEIEELEGAGNNGLNVDVKGIGTQGTGIRAVRHKLVSNIDPNGFNFTNSGGAAIGAENVARMTGEIGGAGGEIDALVATYSRVSINVNDDNYIVKNAAGHLIPPPSHLPNPDNPFVRYAGIVISDMVYQNNATHTAEIVLGNTAGQQAKLPEALTGHWSVYNMSPYPSSQLSSLKLGANSTPTEVLDVVGNGKFSGSATATTFIKSGSSSNSILLGDGNVFDLNRVHTITTTTQNGNIDTLTTDGIYLIGSSATGTLPPFTAGMFEVVRNGNVFITQLAYSRGTESRIAIRNSSNSGTSWSTWAELATTNTVGLKANKAGDTYTGTHDFTGATVTVPTPSPGDFSSKAANTEYVDLAVSVAMADVPTILTGSATLDFGSTSAGTSSELTISVTGAEPGDAVFLGVPSSANQSNSCYTAVVTTADTVDVRFNNYSGSPIDPGSGTFTAKIIK